MVGTVSADSPWNCELSLGLSVAEALERSSNSEMGALTFVDDAMRPTRFSRRELADQAVNAAKNLRSSGVGPGDRVCLLGSTSPAMLVSLFGLWRLGAVPVVLPRARRTTAERRRADVERRVTTAGAVAVLASADLTAELDRRVGASVLSMEDIAARTSHGGAPPMPGPEALGLLQFTSGTTDTSKAVPIRQGQIVDNMRSVLSAVDLTPGDTYLSWLPLFHDMGVNTLAGFAANGLDVVVLATETFVRRPASWMEAASAYRAAATAAPNFAYGLAAKAQELRPRELDLACLRVAFNGAEPVTAQAVEQAIRVFSGVKLAPESICPTYGLAEATLAVTMTDPRERPRFLQPDQAPVTAGVDRPSRPLASCGHPLAGTAVAIRDEGGATLPEDAVGEIHVKGPGTMDGYWAGSGAAHGGQVDVADGWLRTGDLGFVRDGELYVCGRIKDMIIVGGRNLYPEDYEGLVDQVAGVRAGNAIAFSLGDSERMVVVTEGNVGQSPATIGREVFNVLRAGVEHAPHEVVLVRPGTLPKTSSGKRQRGLCRERYLAGELDVVHRVP